MYYETLKPIIDFDKYSVGLTKTLSSEIYWKIFKPLLDVLSGMKENAKQTVLVNAFLTRKIHYSEGFVYGKFTAPISKALIDLGGSFNKTKKAFKVDIGKFSPEVRSALAQGSVAESQAIEKLQKSLQALAPSIVVPVLPDLAQETLSSLHEQFKKVTPADLEIPLALHDYKEEQMIRDYTANVNLSINNLAEDTVYKLRQRVEDAVGQGMRAEKLKGILEVEFGVASNRSKFIARQETSIFTAKYRQVRYEDAGINLYQWSTSNDSRVRESHKELNGRIFRFDDPPVEDPLTGNRANPGEPFGCRCKALAVILQPGKKFTKGMDEGNLLETKEHLALHS